MTQYVVTTRETIHANSPEAAAIEFARILQTNRPTDYAVTAGKQGTVFIRVTRGEAARIA